MAAPIRTTKTGIELEGYDGAIRALNRYSKEAGKVAKGSMREHAKPILRRARALLGSSKGTHQKIKSTVVALSVTNRGVALKLKGSASPLAWAAEFGMKSGGMVPRRTGSGRGYATRYARPYGGAGESFLAYRGFYGGREPWRGDKGFVMGRAIREGLPKFEDAVADDLDDLIDALMTKEGVPRKGRA